MITGEKRRYFSPLGYRRAFTLIELLVCIFVIGILLSLLLMAVQSAREGSRTAICRNSIRQLGLACHQYESVYSHFPAGVAARKSKWPLTTMFVQVLPYTEQQGLFDKISVDFERQANPFSPGLHSSLSIPVQSLGCPSDERVPGPQDARGLMEVGLTSYLGCAGTNYLARDGMFFADSSVTTAGIVDGSSHTVLIGERPPSSDFWLGWWYAGEGQDFTGSLDMVLGAKEINAQTILANCTPGPFEFTKGNVKDPCSPLHFWSLHPGGANFAMADGSVHFLSYSAADILPKLATRAGGEIASLP